MHPLLLILAIGVAGALGAVARYAVAAWMARRWRGHFPLSTLAINVTGAFALGLVLTAGAGHVIAPLRVVLGTGFLGGYTTFSTLSFETQALARRGYAMHAWLNALGTLGVGLLAVAAGIALGHAL
jgi:CrcB protein